MKLKILRLEINDHHHQLRHINSEIMILTQHLRNIDMVLFDAFEEFYSNKIFFFRRNLRQKSDQKIAFNLNNWIPNKQREQNRYVQTPHSHHSQNTNQFKDNIVNLTNTHIPDQVAKVLNLGDRYNHALNPTKNDILNILKNVENTINPFSSDQEREFDEREMNIIRNKILNNINRYDPRKTHITDHERELELNLRYTSKFMKENDEILITKSDKGNKCVLIYKDSYIGKMKEILSDDDQYEKLQRNPLNQIKEKIKSFVKKVNPDHPKNVKHREKRMNNKINISIESTNLARAYGRTQEPNVLSLHKMAENGHDFDWEKPQILDVEPHLNKRLISEMFHIQLNENNINIREDTKKLSGLYKNFFLDLQNHKKFK
ncbi:hypothetical protein QAD02_014529 [Eretmocerus hayati]|uniref:Uncharacterized protein n=1 Tax=Eretmocerus hayati TaxID=131215 RepID=A0ACC2P5R0_9HYME|nr:hypothetical protein QAD02_014529 [Eretmocerus hayati]